MKIAILSNGPGNYSTKRIKEVAQKRGHFVDIIKYRDCYASIERDNPSVNYKGKTLTGYDAIVPRIASYMTNYGSAIVRQFEMQHVYTTTSSIAISRSRDKLRSIQLLSKAGIGIPKTVFSRNTTDIDELLEQLGGTPVIIKLARGTHGNGVVLAETKKAAKSTLQAFYLTNHDGTNILLQEYIEESAGTDIRAIVVSGQVVASMQRQSLDDDFRSNIHQGGEGIPVNLTSEEKRTAVRAAKAMGLGICGVDMMRSSKGPLVLEVNCSPGFAVEKYTKCNVAEAVVRYIEANAWRRRRKDKVGA